MQFNGANASREISYDAFLKISGALKKNEGEKSKWGLKEHEREEEKNAPKIHESWKTEPRLTISLETGGVG